jgi:hypothetical protein
MKIYLVAIILGYCFASAIAEIVRNDVLEITKTVTESNGQHLVQIGYKTVGEVGRVSNIQIIDGYPENVILISGDLITKGKDVSLNNWAFVIIILSQYKNGPITHTQFH